MSGVWVAAFVFFVFVVSASVDALECQEGSADHTIDLYSHPATPGGPTPLAHFELQDQDGLGTCYANNLALMLEAELDGHPQVSYQQIAMAYGMSYNSYDTSRGPRASTSYTGANGTSQMVVEGGWTCSAFDAVKTRHGFLCQRDSVPIERMNNQQSNVMHALGSFYDAYTAIMPGGDSARDDSLAGADNLRRHLREFVRDLVASRGASCVFPRPEPSPPGVTGSLVSLCIANHTSIRNLEEELRTIDASGDEITAAQRARRHTINRDLRRLRQSQERLGVVREVENAPMTQSIGVTSEHSSAHNSDRKNGGRSLECQLLPSVVRTVSEDYYRPLERGERTAAQVRTRLLQLERELHLSGELVSDESDRELLNLYNVDLDYSNQEACRRTAGLMVFYETDTILSNYSERYHMCLGREFASQFGLAVQALTSLSPAGVAPDTALDALARLDLSFQDFVSGIISPDCYVEGSSARVLLPENLSCQTEYYPPLSVRYFDDAGEKISDPVLLRPLQMRDSIANFRTQVSQTIEQGRPLGISLCTSFFNDPTADTNHTMNCPSTGIHAMHAVTVSGVRCHGGQRQYLLQNSWGQNCAAYDSSYECVSEQGSVWMPEDVLVRNINQSYRLDRNAPPVAVPVLGEPAQNVINGSAD